MRRLFFQKSGQRPQEVARLPQFSLYSNNTKRRGRICAISYGIKKRRIAADGCRRIAVCSDFVPCLTAEPFYAISYSVKKEEWNVKYFLTESERRATESTLFFEFQKGKYSGECWKEDSLCLRANVFDRLGLYRLFAEAIPGFDYYNMKNAVNRESWERLRNLAFALDGEVRDLMTELSAWVEACFSEEEVFNVCGI